MPVKLTDLGNGIQAPSFAQDSTAQEKWDSPITQAQKTLSLIDLGNQIERAPLEKQKLELQNHEQQLKNIGLALTNASTGDLTLANKEWQSLVGPNLSLSYHPDTAKRAKGILVSTDAVTGQKTEIDPYAELGIKKRIDLEADIKRDRASKLLSDQLEKDKWIRETGLSLANDGRVGTVREGIDLAKAIALDHDAQLRPGKPQAWPPAPAGARVTDIPPDQVPKEWQVRRGQAQAQLNMAYHAGQTLDPLARGTRKQAPIPEDARKSLNGVLTVNNTMLQDALPTINEFGKSFSNVPNALEIPIRNLLAKTGAQDPRRAALASLLGQNNFENMYRLSGAGYSDKQLAGMSALMPSENDSVNQAMGKIAAQVAINTMNAKTSLDTLQASDVNVSEMRKLFQGQNFFGDAKGSGDVASYIIEKLPVEIKSDRQALGKFLDAFPAPELRRALSEQLAKEGTVFQGGLMDRFKSLTNSKPKYQGWGPK